MKAVVAALGVFAVFPLLHFLPIRLKAWHVMSREVGNLRSAEEGASVQVSSLSQPVYIPSLKFTESPILSPYPAGAFALVSGPGTS